MRAQSIRLYEEFLIMLSSRLVASSSDLTKSLRILATRPSLLVVIALLAACVQAPYTTKEYVSEKAVQGSILKKCEGDKSSVCTWSRPSFSGKAAQMCESVTGSTDHLISWNSIARGYYAAVNPAGKATCGTNLELLYSAVGLPIDQTSIKKACNPNNLAINSVTQADANVLRTLNNSIENLRCAYPSANQSIGSALDIPCSNQVYVSGSAGGIIRIEGISADRIAAFMNISSSDPQPPTVFKVDQACADQLNGKNCPKTRLQTSDCKNDTGANGLPGSTAAVEYWDDGWKKLSPQ